MDECFILKAQYSTVCVGSCGPCTAGPGPDGGAVLARGGDRVGHAVRGDGKRGVQHGDGSPAAVPHRTQAPAQALQQES